MQLTLIRLLVALFCGLPIFASAATQSIHIEWGYTPPNEPAVTGFKLYQEGVFACQIQDPNATAIDCEVTLTAATTNFTLTASFSDSTESPHSAPFAFTTADATVPETTPDDDTTPKTPVPDPDTDTATTESGSKLFTFSWGSTADQTTLKGYKIYLNDVPLCETSTPSTTSIACQADLIRGVMTFGMTQVAADGSESAVSNLLVFDPTAYPELFNTKLVTFNWEYSGTTDITGFRVYQNNALICQTTDPTARQLACTVDINSTPVSYGLTAVQSDGSESILSNLLTYTSDSSTTEPTDTTALKAVITATPPTGTAPVTVDFNGTSSTGSISSFQWDFGDGATATGNTASHAYTNAGAYTTKLTITDAAGQTSIASATVTITEPATPATPPTAIISSSGAAGPAPLTVNFDGSGSTAASGTAITTFSWSFGDGASATGTSASHAFTSAGTYNTTLTVTDSKGLSSTTSTPVVVTAAVITNKAPTAIISATPMNGTAPLTVTLDGSASTDSDGTIASYTWNFGDGSSASGKTVTHTYSTAATFTATLQVVDNLGASGSTGTTITAQSEKPETTALNIEMGEVAVSGDWVRVSLTSTFQNPVVIAGPAGYNDAAPGVIRLRNVNATGFDIKFAEWNYLDGTHPKETVSYLVMEKGRHILSDGSSVEAGSFAGTTSFKTVSFSKAFTNTPVVLTTLASANEADTISDRVKSITTTGFSYYFREQELNKNTHVNETVNFIAWEPGKGTIGSVQFEVAKTANAVTNAWYSTTHQTSFSQAPLLLAGMQTTANTDTSALRVQQLTATGFQVKVEEEQSKDSEVTHPVETVGFIALNQPEEKVLTSFTWTFDAAQEAAINGFQILANGETICTSDAPTARQLSCEITKPTTTTAFTIQAIEKTGGNSTPSNNITYTP